MGTTVAPNAYAGSAGPPVAPSGWVVIAIGAAGVLVVSGLVVMAYASETLPQPGLRASLGVWLVLPYVVAGVVAWRLRPESRLGSLMVVAGFATAANFLVWANDDTAFTVGLACQFLPPVLFLHVFLAFPSGRLESRPERVLVGLSYATAAVTVPALLLGQDMSRNVIAITDLSELASGLQKTQLVLMSALLLSGVGLLIWRRRERGRPLRAGRGLLVDSFGLGLLMIAVLLMAGFFEWSLVQEPFRLATFFVVGLAPIVFLGVMLQARLSRASAAELLVELGVNPGPAELQEAVARALREPSATLAYWLPEFDSYADVNGQQIDPGQMPGRSATPIERDGVPVALILHDPALDEEPRLLAAVAAATGMTIENAQLQVELRARLEELRGSRMRILEAEQRERQRLERDLHDGAQQRLIALSMELGELGERWGGASELRERIEAAREEVTASLAELRDIAHGIHPAAVSDHGLAVALESLATRAPVPVQVVGATQDRLPDQVELAAFFIVSEALANVAKHAQASGVVVRLEQAPGTLIVEVTDDGVGGARADVGTGLRGLADRVEALGGRLRVWSPTGQGTRIRAEIPCE